MNSFVRIGLELILAETVITRSLLIVRRTTAALRTWIIAETHWMRVPKRKRCL